MYKQEYVVVRLNRIFADRITKKPNPVREGEIQTKPNWWELHRAWAERGLTLPYASERDIETYRNVLAMYVAWETEIEGIRLRLEALPGGGGGRVIDALNKLDDLDTIATESLSKEEIEALQFVHDASMKPINPGDGPRGSSCSTPHSR